MFCLLNMWRYIDVFPFVSWLLLPRFFRSLVDASSKIPRLLQEEAQVMLLCGHQTRRNMFLLQQKDHFRCPQQRSVAPIITKLYLPFLCSLEKASRSLVYPQTLIHCWVNPEWFLCYPYTLTVCSFSRQFT